ncbi:MAG: helix-turn-helix transcriptional regulator [Pseudorhodoplanes sp.]|jgi:transcriptional regulator with XRE-family HTH domain|nr:helix-turn-helix transcriptional regulator [Pseudorhodoplanes sp.]
MVNLPPRDPDLSPEQVRAARAWLNWTHATLAERSGVSTRTIERYELDISVPNANTVASIRKAFEVAGVRFSFDGPERGVHGRKIEKPANR